MPRNFAHQYLYIFLFVQNSKFSQSTVLLTQFETHDFQPVRFVVNDRGLFTAGWFGVREKYCSQLIIHDHIRASEQAVYL